MSSTDVPLLHPAFIRRVIAAFTAEVDVVLPEIHGFRQPLSAAYRTALLPKVQALIADDKLKPAFLFEQCRVVRLDDATMLRDRTLAAVDPGLASVSNLNEPSDYQRRHTRSSPLRSRSSASGRLRSGEEVVRSVWQPGPWARSPTLIALSLDEHVIAALNGDQITRDRELPLAAGDTVAFMVADGGG